MKLTRFLAAGVCAAAFSTGAVAQTLSQNPQPAEFPPASFTGTQYVDSRGCVFIRAGVSGMVTWVPRVSRDRRQVCGAQPTQVAGATAAAPARTASAAAPVQIVPTATAQAPAAQPTAAPRVAVTRPAAPAPTTRAPMATVATTITTRPATPAPVTRPSQVPAPVPVATVQQRGGKCPNASDFSNRWVNDGSYGPVRCGPQQMAQGALGGGGSVAAGGERILPAHVYADRFNTQNVAVPEGYVPVWEDGRLNPRRAEQTAQGYRQTQEIWTNTVPRRLTNPAREPRVKEPRIVTPAQAGVKRAEAPVVATRSVAPQQAAAPRVAAKAQPPAAGEIYVQVAMFGVAANARATAQRLAGTGLPVRTGTLTRGGTSYQLVLAGPFATRSDAQAAVGVARRLGFADAYIR